MKSIYKKIEYQKLNINPEVSIPNESRSYFGINWGQFSLASRRTSQVINRLQYQGVNYPV